MDNYIIRTDTAKAINLRSLKRQLLSKDKPKDEDLKLISGLETKFLDGEDITGDRIVLATYPRTGNTFVRKYLELVTEVVTGGDMPISYNIDF